MKITNLIFVLLFATQGYTQPTMAQSKREALLYQLIETYSKARETRDTVLLKQVLMDDVDQLVSTGEWRVGIRAAINGMLQSTTANPGTRTLQPEKIKYLGSLYAIIDCRYEIVNTTGAPRLMWSSFVAVLKNGKWKICAIRNMLPAKP